MIASSVRQNYQYGKRGFLTLNEFVVLNCRYGKRTERVITFNDWQKRKSASPFCVYLKNGSVPRYSPRVSGAVSK
jgi:hypothetical protein